MGVVWWIDVQVDGSEQLTTWAAWREVMLGEGAWGADCRARLAVWSMLKPLAGSLGKGHVVLAFELAHL